MAYNKVDADGRTLIDLTSDTVTADTLVSGRTAHLASGEKVTGTFEPVTGVKGNAESTYRTGNVNLTPANIGAATSAQGTKADNAIQTVQVNGTTQTKTNNTVNISLDKSSVGLGNVDNTSDLNKPISTATQTALNAQQAQIDDNSEVSEVTDTTPYLYKSSEHDAVYDELVGGSVAWNQLVANSGSSLSVTITSGHKYVMKKSGTLSVGASSGSAITGLTGGTDWITDLTLMFGTTIADYVYTLEQSTAGSGIAWLKSYGFFTKDYYPYNAGALTSVNVSGKKVVGKNLLDASQIVVGSIGGQGQDISSNTRLRTAYISVLPNTTYTAISGNNVQVYEYHEYRTDKSHIKFVPINATSGSNTMSPDTHFIRLLFRYSDNRIMEVSDMPNPQLELGSTATNYEPYTSISYPIQSTDLRGLYKLNGNKLYTDGDIYSADGQITRKYGYRDYQSGDESRTNAITDGTHTIFKLSAPTTATAQPFASPQMVYRNGTEEYLDTRDVPIPVGGNRKYVDIPDWMVNEYFDDVRAETSDLLVKIENINNGINEIKSDMRGVTQDLNDLSEELDCLTIRAALVNNEVIIQNTSDFTEELFRKYFSYTKPKFAILKLQITSNTYYYKALINSSSVSHGNLMEASFITVNGGYMGIYNFRWNFSSTVGTPTVSHTSLNLGS